MYLLTFLLVGVLVGRLAGLVVTGHGFGGAKAMLIGVFGALVGGYISDFFGTPNLDFWDVFGTSAIGAIVFLTIAGIASDGRTLSRQQY